MMIYAEQKKNIWNINTVLNVLLKVSTQELWLKSTYKAVKCETKEQRQK